LRILHVIEPARPGVGATGLRLLHDVMAGSADHEHRVVVLGNRDDCLLAGRCGVQPQGAIAVSSLWPTSAGRRLRHLLRIIPADVIHAWGFRPALVVAAAARRQPRVNTFLTPAEFEGSRFHFRWFARQPATRIMCGTLETMQVLTRKGFAPEHVQTLMPAIDALESLFMSRAEVRDRWRREHDVPLDAMVIGLPSDSPSSVDVHVVANAVARMNLSGRPTYLVCHHAGRRRLYSRRFLRQLQLSHSLVLDDHIAEPWRVVRGFDAAVMFAATQSPLPTLWAVAAGVPIIAERDGILNWRDRESALLVPRGDINAFADRISRLHRDPAVGRRLAQNATIDLEAFFQTHNFMAMNKEAWKQAITQ